ncbi:zinc ribbon domain-containing protein [Crocosphaera chwakensis]|uniref:zinc ribbon domain-containing protein n=1 Tax=Crocosphaera chwakensis TaxID=2546361 RepID=UPI002FC3D9B2
MSQNLGSVVVVYLYYGIYNYCCYNLEYKGIKEGVEVIAINPRYTSQTCHCCLHIGLRNNKSFKCSNKACGWIGDADLNGSSMIALVGQSVMLPRGSNLLACPLDSGLQKARAV